MQNMSEMTVWDQVLATVGIVGTAFLLIFFGYLKWRKNQAIKAMKNSQKEPSNPSLHP